MPALSNELVFAIIGVIVSALRYGTYAISIYKKEARPHFFTYFNFGLLGAIGGYAQLQADGGMSAWVLILGVAIPSFFIAAAALVVGEKNITKSDWAAFITALIAIVVWKSTQNPSLVFVLLLTIDFCTYWPTIRKSWLDPWSEPPISYFWAGSRYFFALLAIPTPTLENTMWPLYLMLTDWMFAVMVVYRRKALTVKA